MKRRRISILGLVILWIIFFFIPLKDALAQESAEELYEAAIFKKDAEGDLQGAIQLFLKVITKFPENRKAAAKAQFQIGICYEKLGLKEAQKAFQKVIDNYPDQTDAVKMAKEKLSMLFKAQAFIEKGVREFTIRKVWSGPEVDGLGEISPDGRFLAYTDWTTGDLAILDITAGEKRRLTDKGSWIKSSEFALFLTWSPDSKQIAYNWWNEPNYVDMRVVALDGSKSRTIHKVKNPDEEAALVFGWSPDGKSILTLFWEKHQAGKIGLVSATDGSECIIKALDLKPVRWNEVINMGFSPDGRHIVYDCPAEGSPYSDIFLLSVDGKQEIPLIEHPANDVYLGWVPDGKTIIFASDRRGSMDAYAIQVENGKPKGNPELVKMDIGEILPQGFSKGGSFYYVSLKSSENVYLATIDPETGKILEQPKNPIKHLGKSTHSPAFSPDGKYLAFVSVRGLQFNTRNVLCIRSLETGKDRELVTEFANIQELKWAPNNRLILALATDRSDRGGRSLIFVINTITEDITPITICELPRGQQWFLSPEWSIDGKSIYYIFSDDEKGSHQLLVRNLETGIEKELFRAPKWEERIALAPSPDGRWLAVICNPKGKEKTVIVMPAVGGESHELYKFEYAQNWTSPIAWTVDGKHILFVKGRASEKADEMDTITELWRVSVESGEAQNLGLIVARIYELSAHPDGRKIAFDSYGPSMQMPELWVMENFLPEEKSKKK
jgi:Tol biopolymer transport system component